MNEIFTNKIGTEVFARNMLLFNKEIPHDRVIDPKYRELAKRSLLNDDIECLPIDPPFYIVNPWGLK